MRWTSLEASGQSGTPWFLGTIFSEATPWRCEDQ